MTNDKTRAVDVINEKFQEFLKDLIQNRTCDEIDSAALKQVTWLNVVGHSEKESSPEK